MSQQSLTIGWLYPELMSTYGDRGNIITLQKRAEWRKVRLNIEKISFNSQLSTLNTIDLLFMGGAQDTQQEIVNKDLLSKKGEKIIELIEEGLPGLFICGAYQFLGNYYKDSYGNKIKGLGLFNMYTKAEPDKKRLIGNIVVKPKQSLVSDSQLSTLIVGFENHGGRTFLEDSSQAFGQVLIGHGNNGEDKTEGVHYKNAIGTYLHGPILPMNPHLADYLLSLAFEKKYGEEFSKKEIDDTYAQKAKETMLNKLIRS